jgi:hypothetical protein
LKKGMVVCIWLAGKLFSSHNSHSFLWVSIVKLKDQKRLLSHCF